MGYRYCVFGAGRQGVAAIYDLIKFCEADLVVIYEPSDEAFNLANRRLNDLLGDAYHKVIWTASLNDKQTPRVDWNSFDVMLSCAPWKANFDLTKFAMRWNTPFCDLGGNPETVDQQESLHPITPVVPDCGLSPGISNILAVYLAEKGCDEIKVRCGGIPLTRFNDDLNYRLTFDPMGLISEYSGDVPVIINGMLQYIKALSIVEPYGNKYECSPTSNNSPQVVESLHCLGVREYDYMTIRYNGHWNLVRGWHAAGFLKGNKEMDLHLAEALSKNPELQYDPETHVDKIILSVVGKAAIDRVTEDNMKVTKGFEFEVFADPETKFSAMELMTSWGITMVAHYIATYPSLSPKGFATPERFVPGKRIMDEIQKREGSPG